MESLRILASPPLWAIVGINIILALSMYVHFSAGLFSLSVAPMMAVSAYTGGILTVVYHVPLVPAMLLTLVFASLVGLALAFPALRLRGFYLAITTVGLGELFQVIAQSLKITGGREGFRGMSGTTLGLIFVTALLAFIVVEALDRSRLGAAFRAIRQDEMLASLGGIHVIYIKVLAFVIGTALTAVAGVLYGHYMTFVEPRTFGFSLSVIVLAYLFVGGGQTPWGGVIGATVLTILPELIRSLQEWRMVAFGGLMVLLMILRPQGLIARSQVDAVYALLRRRQGNPAPGVPTGATPAQSVGSGGGTLAIGDLQKHFGGLQVIDGMDMAVPAGSIYGLIGPNGAGKTTIFNLVCGHYTPTGGRIQFRDRSLVGLRPDQITRLGVARTIQTPRFFKEMTVRENISLVQPRALTHQVFGYTSAGQERALREQCDELIQFFGLEAIHDRLPTSLPYGYQRLVEVARAAATGASLILLDEPAAGLNEQEVLELQNHLLRLNQRGTTVVVIDHNMRLIMQLCQHVVVLDQGRKIAEGTPAEIQTNEVVRRAYLGG